MFNSRPKKNSSAEIWRYLRGYDKGNEEYYLGPGESEGQAEGQPAQGELFGKGAERLGLSSIDKKTFSNLARGFSPGGSHQLIQTQNGKHVPGIDVSASVDKSVSVAMIGASEAVRGQIQAGLDDAFDAALRYIEENAALCRPPVRGPPRRGKRRVKKGARRGEVCRTQGSDTERVPGELVVMKVRHSTARPTTEQIERGTPPDVHLHNHGFIFNMAWVPDENEKDGGKWRAIDDCGIKKLRMTLEYVFQGEFARLLEDRLGLEIDYDRDVAGDIRWRLRGIDPAACEFFSTRSREIEAQRREFEQRCGRPPTKWEVRDIALERRRPKDPNFDHDHAPRWASYAEGMTRWGLGVAELAPRPPLARKPVVERESELRERLLGPGGLCRDDALFLPGVHRLGRGALCRRARPLPHRDC